MNIVDIIETTLGFLVYYSGIDHLIRYIQRKFGWSPILMYHSINNREASFFHRGLYRHGMVTEPENFKKQIEYLSDHYTVLPLTTYLQSLKENQVINNIATITFDDGFKDFADNALPILKTYECPSTVFVVGNCLLNNSPIWLHELYELTEICLDRGIDPIKAILNHNPRIDIPREQDKLYRFLIYTNDATRQEVLSALRHAAQGEKNNTCSKYLNKSDVSSLAKQGVFFGAHTMNHLKASALSDDELNEEIHSSIQLTASISKQKEIPFATTFGGPDAWDNRIAQILQRENAVCCCTTREGLNSKRANIYKINRIDVSFTKNLYAFIFRIVGLRAALERIVEKPYYLLPKAKNSKYGLE